MEDTPTTPQTSAPQAAPVAPAPVQQKAPAAPVNLTVLDGAPANSEPSAKPVETPVSWHSSLPENIRNNKTLLNVKAANEKEALVKIAEQFVHAQSLIGKAKPDPTWTTEMKRNWYQEYLGTPKDPTGYSFDKLTLPEGAPEDLLDKEGLESFRSVFHEAGLNQEQLNKLLPAYYEYASKQRAQAEQAYELQKAAEVENQYKSAMTQLKKEWGQDFDNNVGQIKNTLQQLMSDEEYDSFVRDVGPEVKNNPTFLNLMLKVANQFSLASEAGLDMRTPGSAISSLNTVESVDAELKAIRSHPVYAQVLREGGLGAIKANYMARGKEADYYEIEKTFNSLNDKIPGLTQRKVTLAEQKRQNQG